MISLVIMDPVERRTDELPAKLGGEDAPRQGSRALRPGVWALIVAAALQVVLVFTWVHPGPLSIDEVIYQWMAGDLVAGHGLALDNGFDQRPSPELATFYMVTAGDRLMAQYPYGYPLLAAPAVRLFGLYGLFLVNALAFVAALVLTWRIGIRLLRDPTAVALGLGILVVATFAWEYSMAAWPHALALAAQLWAFDLLLTALDSPDGGMRLRLAAGAGLVAGAGATLRLDSIFLVGALALPFLLAAPIRWRELAALVAGTLPALAFLALTNWLRWGNPSPFSYGVAGGLGELRRYLPPMLAGVLALTAAIALTRPGIRAALARRPRLAWVAAAAAVALVLLVPAGRALALRFGHGLRVLLVDLRGESANFAGDLVVRDFAMIYANGIKKALLQSCPWLAVAALPYLIRPRDAAERRALLLLALVPAVLVPVYSFFSWHGGLGLNLRYFLPVLPFLALLAGRALREQGRGMARAELLGVVAAGAGAVAVYALLAASRDHEVPAERAVLALDAPLAIAALTAGLVALAAVRARAPQGIGRPLRRAVLCAAAVGLGWAAGLAFEYDATWSRALRGTNLLQAVAVAPHVSDGALLFGYYPDHFATVRNLRPEVTIAFPRQDGFADFRPLAQHWLDVGRPVFAVLTPADWNYLRARGQLEGLEFRVAARGDPFPLMEMRRSGAEGGP